jgi:hypothetical protein
MLPAGSIQHRREKSLVYQPSTILIHLSMFFFWNCLDQMHFTVCIICSSLLGKLSYAFKAYIILFVTILVLWLTLLPSMFFVIILREMTPQSSSTTKFYKNIMENNVRWWPMYLCNIYDFTCRIQTTHLIAHSTILSATYSSHSSESYDFNLIKPRSYQPWIMLSFSKGNFTRLSTAHIHITACLRKAWRRLS